MKTRLMMVLVMILMGIVYLGNPTSAIATCTRTSSVIGPTDFYSSPNDNSCVNINGLAYGIAVYSCANYDVPGFTGWGCYYHSYECDTTCGGPGTDGCFVPDTLVGNKSEGKKIEEVHLVSRHV